MRDIARSRDANTSSTALINHNRKSFNPHGLKSLFGEGHQRIPHLQVLVE